MPELPEIETIKNGLLLKVVGEPILKVVVNNESVIKNSKKDFIKMLKDGEIASITRRGKMLIFDIRKEKKSATENFLLARLGMTGRLVHFGKEDALWGGYSFKNKKSFSHKHCHIILSFQDGGVLLFCDMRRFGYMEIVNKDELERKFGSFGPEPLSTDFTLRVFQKIVAAKKTNIKALLMNQKYIAGIGNIYADEILFEAKINPRRIAGSLSEDEVEAIYKAIKKILRKAVTNRGTTFSDYVDVEGNGGGFQKYLKVYGREGEKCAGCEGRVQKVRLAGRGTHFCPRCQK